jgi:hypothetical protein
MTAAESRRYAEHVVLPPLLAAAGIAGRLRAIERVDDPHTARILRELDTIAGVDFWVETPRGTRIGIASRVQWHQDDGHPRRSFTIRTDIGGSPTEVHKRLAAIADDGLYPAWTAQGYVTADGRLHHAGIIRTVELYQAYREASADPRHTTIIGDDGHTFWPAHWATLRRHRNATSLHTIGDTAHRRPAQPSLLDEATP